MYVYTHTHLCVYTCHEGHKRVWDPQELQLISALGTELGSSGRAAKTLTSEPFLKPIWFHFYVSTQVLGTQPYVSMSVQIVFNHLTQDKPHIYRLG